MDPTNNQTYYDVLGVAPDADTKTIRQAYLRLSLQHHPDKNPDRQEEAKANFIRIGEAYDVLKDPAKRAAYDRDLAFGTWRDRWGGGGATSPGESAKRYENYENMFDAAVAGMSESELRAAMGAAAMLGSVIGSVVGSRLGKNSTRGGGGGGGSSILSTAGSMVGSVVASEAASNLVKSVHEQSKERVEYEQRRRVAMERGEAIPDPPPRRQGWMDVIGKTVESVKEKASVAGAASAGTNRGAGSMNSNDSNDRKWKRAVGTALNVAEAFAEIHAASSSKRQSGR